MRLQSRRNNSFNRHYPLIVEALGDLPEDTVVDGEVVALDDPVFPTSACFRTTAAKRHASISLCSIFFRAGISHAFP